VESEYDLIVEFRLTSKLFSYMVALTAGDLLFSSREHLGAFVTILLFLGMVFGFIGPFIAYFVNKDGFAAGIKILGFHKVFRKPSGWDNNPRLDLIDYGFTYGIALNTYASSVVKLFHTNFDKLAVFMAYELHGRIDPDVEKTFQDYVKKKNLDRDRK